MIILLKRLIWLLIYFLLLSFASGVRIGSFNLHQYGPKKADNATLTNFVAQILNDFDVAVVQEITDVNLRAPGVLYNALNQVSKTGSYSMALSDRVGRSATKEQYIFFNRESTSGLQLVKAYLYNDVSDLFERPPYIATYKVVRIGTSGVKFFTIMNAHLRPDSAYNELVNMRVVIRDFIQKNSQYFSQTSTSLAAALASNVINATATNKPSLNTDHPILIMGDLNADCSYISLTAQQTLRTINYADFVWLIENQVKTNTRQTCTYDRIFVNGNAFIKAVVAKSNTTVDFRTRFGMTLDQALGVSDHFPIKFDITW